MPRPTQEDYAALRVVFRAALRRARFARGITQAHAAREIGISLKFYGCMERGTALPNIATLKQISRALGVRVDALLGRPGAGAQPELGAAGLAQPEPRHEAAASARSLARAAHPIFLDTCEPVARRGEAGAGPPRRGWSW